MGQRVDHLAPPESEQNKPHIILLLGGPGSGKSTLGSRLAPLIQGVHYVDDTAFTTAAEQCGGIDQFLDGKNVAAVEMEVIRTRFEMIKNAIATGNNTIIVDGMMHAPYLYRAWQDKQMTYKEYLVCMKFFKQQLDKLFNKAKVSLVIVHTEPEGDIERVRRRGIGYEQADYDQRIPIMYPANIEYFKKLIVRVRKAKRNGRIVSTYHAGQEGAVPLMGQMILQRMSDIYVSIPDLTDTSYMQAVAIIATSLQRQSQSSHI
jgi:adenylate kinase family enzyme